MLWQKRREFNTILFLSYDDGVTLDTMAQGAMN